MKKQKKRVFLVILDGWEHTESKIYNAIYTENTPEGNGELKDVAPTILDLLGLKKPEVMTGRSLFE
tara:strand:+ start:670 stop:867 length:198 start_codon:yes stop_codon:yes gene_type:complete